MQLVGVGWHHNRAGTVKLRTVVAGRSVGRSLNPGSTVRGAGWWWTTPHTAGRSWLLLLRRHTGVAGWRLLLRRGGGWGLWPTLGRAATVVPWLRRILGLLLRASVTRVLSHMGGWQLGGRRSRRAIAWWSAITAGHNAIGRPAAVNTARTRRTSSAITWITVGRHPTAGHRRSTPFVHVRRWPHVGWLAPVVLGWPGTGCHRGGGAAAAHWCCSVTFAGTASGPRGHRHRSCREAIVQYS